MQEEINPVEHLEEIPEPKKNKPTLKGMLLFCGAFALIILFKALVKKGEAEAAASTSTEKTIESGYYSLPCYNCRGLISKAKPYIFLPEMPQYPPERGYIFCGNSCANAFKRMERGSHY